MASSKCPYCGGVAMNPLMKLIRGSRRAYKCDSCGKCVGISKWARLLGLLLIIAFFAIGLPIEDKAPYPFDEYAIPITAAITVPIWCLLQVYLIPIRKKEDENN